MHAIICITGGLVITLHNNICDEILYLSRIDFTPAPVRSEPLIHQVCTRSEQEICQGNDKYKEKWGDVMIWVLWDRKVEAIIDVKLMRPGMPPRHPWTPSPHSRTARSTTHGKQVARHFGIKSRDVRVKRRDWTGKRENRKRPKIGDARWHHR